MGGIDWQFLDYHLPEHLIAQEPCPARDGARLLLLRRDGQSLAHRRFLDLPELLNAGDLLILNDTRVLPARLLGRRKKTAGKWEGLFLGQLADGAWEILCRTRGRLLAGEIIAIDPGPLELELVEKFPQGAWRARPSLSGEAGELLRGHGRVPLPPYIRKGMEDPGHQDRYQTIYAGQVGAVAAPTAGLHFSQAVFDQLQQRGIEWAFLTLHVGRGTFQPIEAEDFRAHRLHQEWCELPAQTAAAITSCQARGGRIVAVGTTSARVLESVAQSGPLRPWSGGTDLYIIPPFPFRVVNGLLTNFHLPRTTLLLLVGAFAGVELLQQAYKTAIAEQYRFYSYGDAMLIL